MFSWFSLFSFCSRFFILFTGDLGHDFNGLFESVLSSEFEGGCKYLSQSSLSFSASFCSSAINFYLLLWLILFSFWADSFFYTSLLPLVGLEKELVLTGEKFSSFSLFIFLIGDFIGELFPFARFFLFGELCEF